MHTTTTNGEDPMDDKQRLIVEARAMRAAGKSLYEIATRLRVTKEWLRTYAGLVG